MKSSSQCNYEGFPMQCGNSLGRENECEAHGPAGMLSDEILTLKPARELRKREGDVDNTSWLSMLWRIKHPWQPTSIMTRAICREASIQIEVHSHHPIPVSISECIPTICSIRCVRKMSCTASDRDCRHLAAVVDAESRDRVKFIEVESRNT